MVNAGFIHSPQTGHPWFVEMDHNMQDLQMYSLIPQKNDNQFVSHYHVESRRPRLIGKFTFSDAWLTSQHCLVQTENDLEIHLTQTFFNPERANNKLFFDRPPLRRMEIVAPNRFIGDREIFDLLDRVMPRGSEIHSLVQRLP